MARNPYPSELADRFQVRMPEGLRDRIAKAAEANNRSMNAEIVARLEGSFSGTSAEAKEIAEIAAKTAIDSLLQEFAHRPSNEAFKKFVANILSRNPDWPGPKE